MKMNKFQNLCREKKEKENKIFNHNETNTQSGEVVHVVFPLSPKAYRFRHEIWMTVAYLFLDPFLQDRGHDPSYPPHLFLLDPHAIFQKHQLQWPIYVGHHVSKLTAQL